MNKKSILSRAINKLYALINLNRSIHEVKAQNYKIQEELDSIKLLMSKILIKNNLKNDVNNIQLSEFKVFSQREDDGIIQHIINNIEFKHKTFIEFGVETYTESNTRFLLINNNWSGLIIDGSNENIDYIKRDQIYWKYDLKAIQCFITRNNINDIIESSGFNGKTGILSIDIDGNDYWIWEAITVIEPTLVIIEFNAVFNIDRPITIPYDEKFIRQKAHYSYLYFGASLTALISLGKSKGYSFIGTNSAGVNAYFVKNENIGNFEEKSANEKFSISKFSESRDRNNRLNFLSYEDRQKAIRGMPVYNVETNLLEPF